MFHKCRVDNEILEKACISQFFNKLAILYFNWTMYGVWISWSFFLQQNLNKKSKSKIGRSIAIWKLVIFLPTTYYQSWSVLWLVEKWAVFRWPVLDFEYFLSFTSVLNFWYWLVQNICIFHKKNLNKKLLLKSTWMKNLWHLRYLNIL